jgi:7-dehydrocholesterol reductase
MEERPGPIIPRWWSRTAGPLLLLLFSPPFAILLWHVHVRHGGSALEFGRTAWDNGILSTVWAVWRPVMFGSKAAWIMIAVFAAVQLLFVRLLPGREFRGPVTPEGNVPVYRANGVLAFLLTVGLYCGLSFGLGLFSPGIIYDHFGEILGGLNTFSLLFCLFLYLKGRFFPSSSDHSHTGNFIFDYYWGTELYPRVLGWDVKMFTNCRFGMMGWPLIVISFAAKQAELHGLSDAMIVAAGLQLIYIAKFFWWETGYLGSMDIMHDRAGFYICWGVLVWLPSIYTSATLYLVNHPHSLGMPAAVLLFAAGVVFIFMNYFADAQRQKVRALGGKCTVWGKEPVLITGHYTTGKGEKRESLLLASGWWGISRHFHYVPEWLAAFCWTVPVLFSNLLPFFYVIFLGILLTHRAFRDDRRCAAKYGGDWKAYCEKVPYKIIPGVV